MDSCAISVYHLPVGGRDANDPRLAFGRAVRDCRLRLKLSQERLAELAEIHRTYLGDIERGARNISLLNMTRIARALKIPLSRLIRETEKST
jgi:transcriptional regulator with XRE-family HTH domain